ncbi:hypothetical protein [Candidatus Berkiella aquae]|uniref:Uncharacterized protein n=1 Tax=Candidatus Berkiella aquae TaxID=295108 RepID=A0A0Q9YJK0_9GAMM|nr:hypothetical protein [Candidatus Berkiella aquae]MCS5711314.1 hypothetical protein [Candidatus Berkiella aquae]
MLNVEFYNYVNEHCTHNKKRDGTVVTAADALEYAQKGKEFLNRLQTNSLTQEDLRPQARAENMAYLQWYLIKSSFDEGKPFGKGTFTLSFDDPKITEQLYIYFRSERDNLFSAIAAKSSLIRSLETSEKIALGALYSPVNALRNALDRTDKNPTYSRSSSHFNKKLKYPEDGHYGIDAKFSSVPLPWKFKTSCFGLCESGNETSLYIKPESEGADVLRNFAGSVKHGFNFLKVVFSEADSQIGLERFAENKFSDIDKKRILRRLAQDGIIFENEPINFDQVKKYLEKKCANQEISKEQYQQYRNELQAYLLEEYHNVNQVGSERKFNVKKDGAIHSIIANRDRKNAMSKNPLNKKSSAISSVGTHRLSRLSKEEQLKEELIKIIVKTLYTKDFSSTQEFLDKLKSNHPNHPMLNELKVDNKDDKYGILTLTLKNTPPASDVEFRLKKKNAYGGPKTEDYLDRVNLKMDAAIALAKENPVLQSKIPELEAQRRYFVDQLEKDCHLDHLILGELNKYDPRVKEEFDTKHEKALAHMAVLMTLLTETLKQEDKSPEQIKADLYNKERNMMSQRRPERVTVRKLDSQYIEVNTSTPVKKDKTISSAKKDEVGVANWVKSTNEIYSNTDGEINRIHQDEGYRSASIIPHELISKGEFTRILAIEVARRNVVEDILPQLAAELIQKGKDGNPLVINYEMLTLLSPIHKVVDRKDTNNPDATQFSAIRAAINHYDGRTFNIKLPDGTTKEITFNGIYHNYGANLARGFKIENATNKKAYNLILDRSVQNLLAQKESARFHNFLKGMPEFTNNEKEKINANKARLKELYEQIERKELLPEEHNKLVSLNTKRLESGLSEAENEDFDKLSAQFNEYREFRKSLMKEARALEVNTRHIHVDLAKRRASHCEQNYENLNAKLSVMELINDPEQKKVVDHLRALIEFTRLAELGYDSKIGITKTLLSGKDIKETNKRNYEIQSYIQLLSVYNDFTFHKTCKSGKDRTNTAEEKFKAKTYMHVKLGRIPKYKEAESIKRAELNSYEKGYLQGPGNDICGDNMRPGAQQVAAKDVATDTLDIRPVQAMAGLQKGIDSLKAKPEDVVKAKSALKSYRNASAEIDSRPTQEKPARPQSPRPQPFVSHFKGQTILHAPMETAKPTVIMNVPQLPSRVLYEQLTSFKEMNQLSHFGIKDFQLLDDPNKSNSGSHHLTINMYSTVDKSANAKITQVHAEADLNSNGITYSIDKNQPPDEKQQTIEQVCKLAVATAKPGTEFKITTKEPERSTTQAALDMALLAKYPNRYVRGEFKVPTTENSTPKVGM